MWTVRKAVWNRLAVMKFGANKPVRIDFGYLALDTAGAGAFTQFKRELEDLQRRLEAEPAASWKVTPAILEANINA